MAATALCWRHVSIHAHGTWLHGDPRGFRSRDHRIHSSGDYKAPPPEGEHRGLHEYHKRNSRDPTNFAWQLRKIIVEALVWRFLEEGHGVLAAAVTQTHAHALVPLPDNKRLVHDVVGRCKAKAGWAVGLIMPAPIWAAGGSYERVVSRSHQLNTFH